MNGYDVGGRSLRVGTADQEGSTHHSQHHYLAQQQSQQQQSQQQHQQHYSQRSFQPLAPSQMPPGMQPGTGSTSVDEVNAILAAMPNGQLVEIMGQMKAMAVGGPEQTRQLLLSNPALAYTLFHAMVMMRLVEPSIVHQIIGSAALDDRQAPVQAPSESEQQQRELIMQIMAMTPEQVDALPPQQRDQVIQLRSQLALRAEPASPAMR